MMTTAAFRISRDLLGDVCVYPFPPPLAAAMDALNRRWQTKSERSRAPYASLATALSAVTGQPVRIMPGIRRRDGEVWLVTTAPIDPSVLFTATRAWERLVRGDGSADVLASLLTEVTPVRMDIGGAVSTSVTGRATADGWVYQVLGWVIAQRLASQAVDFDGRRVPFRLDSQGDLVSWNDPITRTLRDGRTARALVRITPHVKTLPGVGDLVCILEVSLTRLVEDLRSVKWVWIDHGRSAGGSSLLRLPITSRKTADGWERTFRDYSAAVTERCDLDPLPWGEDVLTRHPDRVRAGRGVTWSHPVGVGVGTRTYLRLMEHAQRTLGIEPVSYEQTSVTVLHNNKIAKAPISPADLDRAIQAAGYNRLRIVHLSAWPTTRERVRKALDAYRFDDSEPLLPDVGVVQPLTGHAEMVAYDIPSMLAHGQHERGEPTACAPLLKADGRTLVLALADTAYEPGQEDRDDDAKPVLRRALAERGVASQFLAYPPDSDGSLPRSGKRTRKKADTEKPHEDYPVVTAVKDLLRAGGLSDQRLAKAVALAPFPLDLDAWLVGVHVRRQNTPRKTGVVGAAARPRLVSVLVALHARTDLTIPWDFRLHIPGRGWLPHAAGITAFHAGPIGSMMGNRQDAYTGLRNYVDRALSELPGNDPVVVMADAGETRRIWSGLSDSRLREGLLPGDSLPTGHQVTVVRVGTEECAVPRPIDRTGGPRSRKDPRKPASPRNRVYQLTGDDGTTSWLLGQASRTFDAGAEGRVGADFTRFTLPAVREAEQENPWHSFTGTEFVVARSGVFSEEAAMALTARLCAQPVSWDGRTRRPVPLHLACIADETHPSYRMKSADGPAENRES